MDNEKIDIVAKKKKHSLIKNEDTRDVKEYIVKEIKNDIRSTAITLLFNTIDLMSGTFKQSVQKMIGSQTGIQQNIPQNLINRHTNYQGIYKMQNPYADTINPNNIYKRNVYDYENLEFTTQAAAELVLHRMKQHIQNKGYVEVGIFYQEAGLPYSNVDLNYGWTNLNNAVIQRNSFNHKWVILMPRAIEIEKE